MGNNRREGFTHDEFSELLDPIHEVEEGEYSVSDAPKQEAPPENQDEKLPGAALKKPCPRCGKKVTWTLSNQPRAHKCVAPKTEEPPQEQQVPSPQPTVAAPTAVTIDVVIAKYIETRDAIAAKEAALKEELAVMKELQVKREAWLLSRLTQENTKSVKASCGTCFLTTKNHFKVSDAGAFFDWVGGDWSNRRAFVQSQIVKPVVVEYVENTEELPPGVSLTSFETVQVRKS